METRHLFGFLEEAVGVMSLTTVKANMRIALVGKAFGQLGPSTEVLMEAIKDF